MKLLAAELAEQIRNKTADTLTRQMYVHVKGMPRRQEAEELHDSKKYKTALAQALADDKLYRDCIELNVQPDSLLVARYMEDEEAFAIAGFRWNSSVFGGWTSRRTTP